jgi:hypothetical protein
MNTLKRAISKVVYPLFLSKGDIFAAIMLHWNDIVGYEYQEILSPISIDMHHTNGNVVRTLVVSATCMSYGVRMTFMQNQIISKVNNYFGFSAIHTLKVCINDDSIRHLRV